MSRICDEPLQSRYAGRRRLSIGSTARCEFTLQVKFDFRFFTASVVVFARLASLLERMAREKKNFLQRRSKRCYVPLRNLNICAVKSNLAAGARERMFMIILRANKLIFVFRVVKLQNFFRSADAASQQWKLCVRRREAKVSLSHLRFRFERNWRRNPKQNILFIVSHCLPSRQEWFFSFK